MTQGPLMRDRARLIKMPRPVGCRTRTSVISGPGTHSCGAIPAPPLPIPGAPLPCAVPRAHQRRPPRRRRAGSTGPVGSTAPRGAACAAQGVPPATPPGRPVPPAPVPAPSPPQRQEHDPADAHASAHKSVLESAQTPAWTRRVHRDAPGQRHRQQPRLRDGRPPE